MDYNDFDIVNFAEYCKKCKYRDLKEAKDPCNECLEVPVRLNSEKPICYQEDIDK